MTCGPAICLERGLPSTSPPDKCFRCNEDNNNNKDNNNNNNNEDNNNEHNNNEDNNNDNEDNDNKDNGKKCLEGGLPSTSPALHQIIADKLQYKTSWN